MAQRTEGACALMKEILLRQSEPASKAPAARKGFSPKAVGGKALSPKVARVGKVLSPRPTRATRLRAVPAAPKKAPLAKTRTRAAVHPVTPKAPARMGKMGCEME
jgi:separase